MKSVYEIRYAKIGETTAHYRSDLLKGSQDAKYFARKHLSPYFSDKCNQEEFLVVTLDTQHRPIRIVRITRGTLDASLVHPREVFAVAITDAANCIIMVHNHPSGDPTPSREDIVLTARMAECGKLLGISVLDHLIVGDDEHVLSMADSGYFATI